MAPIFQSLIVELQKQIPQLITSHNGQWNSLEPGYREIIRADLKQKIQSITPAASLNELDDLKKPPRPKDWSVSIAHCLTLGGWAAVPRPWRVGLDIEQLKRVSNAIVDRVSGNEERKLAPTVAALWGAKESAFKALEHEQPKVIAQITIDQWHSDPRGWLVFKSSTHRTLTGYSCVENDLIFSIALVSA